MPRTYVQGLAGLQRALAVSNKAIAGDLRDSLKDAAEPVRVSAETLAVVSIPRIGVPWSRMRVGVTRRSVYVAPVQRGVKARGNARLRRPNLKGLLLDRAMYPALVQHESSIESRVIDMLDDFARRWATIG